MIGGKVVFIPSSDEAKTLHEAGHAFAAMMVGVRPNFMEFIDDPSSIGSARLNAKPEEPFQAMVMACGGYASELNLYRAGRLVDQYGDPVSEKAFIHQAIGIHAHYDKANYFLTAHSEVPERWSVEQNRRFMLASADFAPSLPMQGVSKLAEGLLEKRRLRDTEIIEIARPHLSDEVLQDLQG